jgi:hypothetical protein
MSVTWFDWEIQEEGTTPDTRYRPAPTDNPFGRTLDLGKTGHAEIKPHHLRGIRDGLRQLDRSKVTGPKVLITYRPLNSGSRIAQTGVPALLQMFMTCPKKGAKPPEVLAGQWWKLGSVKPPPQVALTVDNPGLFGAGIEDFVRNHFCERVLQPRGHRMHPNTGGNRRGADVLWDELAEMYGELGRELRDPFYAELAVALAGPRR